MALSNEKFVRLDKYYTEGFFLSDASVIKLDELIQARIGIECTKTFSVVRSDRYEVIDSDISVVINQPNTNRDSINEVLMNYNSEKTDVDLRFSKKDGIYIKTISNDRDTAFLCYTDIDGYINSTISSRELFAWRKIFDARTLPIALLAIMSVFMFYTILDPKIITPPIPPAAGANIDQKIDWLIANAINSKSNLPIWTRYISIFFIAPFLLIIFGKRIENAVSSPRVFMWGQEVDAYNKYKSNKEKIIWGFFVALLVGLLSTFIYSKIQ